MENVFLSLPDPLVLESRERLERVRIAYREWGERREGGTIVLIHGLTRSHRALDPTPEATEWSPHGWARPFAAPGGPLDPARHHILCANLLGSPFGSTSPIGSESFPSVSVFDQARALRVFLTEMRIEVPRAIVGFSLGGTVALAYAAVFPEQVRTIATLAGPASLPAGARRSLATAAQGLEADGDYRAGGERRRRALQRSQMALLRALYTTTWLLERYSDHFAMERALETEARLFSDSFDARCWVSLARCLAFADVAPALKAYKGRAAVIANSSDELAPPTDMRDTYHALAAAGARARYFEIQSEAGHRAAYLEPAKTVQALKDALG